ncbi:hypothetical protein RHSIM_Rhsim11G0116100 [Rhododendron simsii]|uniref:Uncharacterized protein n=1 Tax=Rhododendron simsii TaxID=118357 RepID=A0A834GCS2_RHOSS|nr:hypothetical protein RHSIM_Rhsim11G0116100 [Rhododendron simsii]
MLNGEVQSWGWREDCVFFAPIVPPAITVGVIGFAQRRGVVIDVGEIAYGALVWPLDLGLLFSVVLKASKGDFVLVVGCCFPTVLVGDGAGHRLRVWWF